jgi:tetratricopeptide (TPR) repeat protein
MSSAQPAKNGPKRNESPPSSVPIGVRTHAVVSGRWVAIALAAAAVLAAMVFFVLPTWLAPSRDTPPATPASAPPAPAAPARAVDPGETVRQRLAAEEAAARYREASEALQQKAAPEWAPREWSAATARAGDAVAAISSRDYARAVKLYDDALQRLRAISEQADAAFERALAAGAAAIEARASVDAVKAFKMALMIRPADRKAQHGLGRAERLDEVIALFADGESQEKAGALAQARRHYADAAKLDPEFAPVRAALARVDARLAAARFDEVMTRGLAQLEQSDWSGAERSFSAALKIRPAHAAAADGLARAQEGRQRESLARLQRDARLLEPSERWEEALALYRRAEAIDPTIAFASEGIARARRMIALHARIDAYLAKPERLYSAAVRTEVSQFLATLDNEATLGPRLAQERQRLETALKRASTRITVKLSSDNATEVTLYRVGRLGQFQNREIALTPGTYTLVGSRPGYKDVRVELTVSPESDSPSVFIACEDRV